MMAIGNEQWPTYKDNFSKLGVASRTEAVSLVLQHNLIT